METWPVNADAAYATVFVYCHLFGPDSCAYYTGKCTGDIFSRFENTVTKLDVKTAKNQGWKNATLNDKTLSGLKLLAFYAICSLSSTF